MREEVQKHGNKGASLAFIANRRRIRDLTEDESMVAVAIKNLCQNARMSRDGRLVLYQTRPSQGRDSFKPMPVETKRPSFIGDSEEERTIRTIAAKVRGRVRRAYITVNV